MADISGKDDSTSGPLAWLIAIPAILFVLAVPTVVVSSFLFVFLIVLDSIVGLPTLTLGISESTNIPADWVLPLLLSAVLGILVSIGLVARNGFDWDGTESDGRVLGGNGPFR